MQRVQVRSLVRELRSHMTHSPKETEKKRSTTVTNSMKTLKIPVTKY